MKNWAKQIAIVTGGGSGIGRALAMAMAQRGATVIIADINQAAAEKTAAECGPAASWRRLDVADAAAVRECIESVVQKHGRLDYLFNNAGIGIGGETHELTLAAWERILDINVRGVIHGVAVAYPIMVKQGSGHIINTASMAGLAPAPLLTPYAMSKHAVVGLGVSLRIEGAALGVRVSTLCPAAIETPLLDSDNPPDLPPLSWRPDVRRFLTRLAGPPYSVEKCATETLNAIERNANLIVIPGRARFGWRLGRLFPWLIEKGCLDAVAAERAHRNPRK